MPRCSLIPVEIMRAMAVPRGMPHHLPLCPMCRLMRLPSMMLPLTKTTMTNRVEEITLVDLILTMQSSCYHLIHVGLHLQFVVMMLLDRVTFCSYQRLLFIRPIYPISPVIACL